MPQPPPRPTSPPVGGDDRRPLADAEGSGSRSSTTARRHFANVLKGFIGSNFLAVPFAFAASGLLLGPLAVGLVAAVSGYGCLLLVGIRRRLRPPEAAAAGRALETYPQVAGAVLGPSGSYLVEAALILTQFGYCIGYMIYMTTALHQLAPSLGRGAITFLLLTPPLVLLCAIPDLRRFLPFSALSNLALLLAFLAILGEGLQRITDGDAPHFFHPSALRPSDASKLPLAFGNLVAAFEGIGTVLPVEHAMAQAGVRGAYPPLLRAALLLIALLFTLFGVVGYGAFGPDICSVVLSSLPAGAATDVARVAMVVGLFFTFGFQLFPVLELVDVRLSEPASHRSGRYNLFPSFASSSSSSSPASDAHAGGRTPLLLGPERDADGDGEDHAVQPSTSPAAAPPPRRQPHPPKHDGYGALQSPQTQTAAAHTVGPRHQSWLLPPPGHYSRRRPLVYLGSRAAAVLLAALVAHLLPEFELIVAFVGSLGASILAFVVPGLLALRCFPRASPGQRAGFVGLVVFGVAGGGIGAGYAVRDMIRGRSQC